MGLNDPFLKRYLLKPLIGFVVLVVLLVGLEKGLSYENEQLKHHAKNAEDKLQKVVMQIRFLQYQEQLFAKYGDQYSKLINFGLVNAQDRVKWTDALLSIKQKLALNPFSIQFEPEVLIKRNQLKTIKINRNIFYVTKLNLNMGMYSDYDILRLLEKISSQITPLYLVNKCHLTSDVKLLKTIEFNPQQAILSASCVLTIFESRPRHFEEVGTK